MVLRWVCVSGSQCVLPGSPLPRCWGKWGRKHRGFAVRNPFPVLQAKKLVTCTAGLPIHISQSPFASACWTRGRKENQLSGEHPVPVAPPCPCWRCPAPLPAPHGRLAPNTAMQAASHWDGWKAAAFLRCPSLGAAELPAITRRCRRLGALGQGS